MQLCPAYPDYCSSPSSYSCRFRFYLTDAHHAHHVHPNIKVLVDRLIPLMCGWIPVPMSTGEMAKHPICCAHSDFADLSTDSAVFCLGTTGTCGQPWMPHNRSMWCLKNIIVQRHSMMVSWYNESNLWHRALLRGSPVTPFYTMPILNI